MINSDMRFISRTNSGMSWQVQARRNKQTMFNKSFSDIFYGGIASSLTEAKLYRDSIQDDIEKESKSIFAGTKPPFYHNAQINSKSQVVGVCRCRSDKSSNGRLIDQWVASWQSESTKLCRKAFSITKYGNEEAFKLAFEARQIGISERMKIENKMVLVK